MPTSENEITSPEPDFSESSKSENSESESDDQVLIPISEVEKSGEKSALELEPEIRPRIRRGRKPTIPLLKQVEQAYARLNDFDWIEKSQLSRLDEVQQRSDSNQVMSRAQGLRGLLMQAARQVITDLEAIPDKGPVKVFLEGYLRGKSITELAQELDVSREWASRRYRKEAIGLASAQFIRLVSQEDETEG